MKPLNLWIKWKGAHPAPPQHFSEPTHSFPFLFPKRAETKMFWHKRMIGNYYFGGAGNVKKHILVQFQLKLFPPLIFHFGS